MGPNGSGKTTLIRTFIGIVKPNSGTIRLFGGQSLHKSVLSQIGYMPQSEALYQDLTVRENVTFFGRVYGVGTEEHVREVIGLVGLGDRADSIVSTLSGGMRRRVSLACAMVHRPKLLLLDEPTVGIDPQLRAIFWQHFYQLNREGITIIVSSHVMDEAERCHRLGLLREGKLLAEGSAEELRSRSGKPTLEDAFLYYAEGSG